MREVEVKVKVADIQELRGKLESMGFEFTSELSQHDVIFNKNGDTRPWGRAEFGDAIPRIRMENGVCELNVKVQQTSESDNLEYETVVESHDQALGILRALGWEPFIEVKKRRLKGHKDEYTICLDSVEGLGDYMEIEKLVEDTTELKDVEEELFTILATLGIQRDARIIQGYDTLLFMQKEHEKKV